MTSSHHDRHHDHLRPGTVTAVEGRVRVIRAGPAAARAARRLGGGSTQITTAGRTG
jgi:hypothetical protein